MRVIHREDVINAMSKYGGSFIKALAEAMRRADEHNFKLLIKTFSGYWDEYTEIAFRDKFEM